MGPLNLPAKYAPTGCALQLPALKCPYALDNHSGNVHKAARLFACLHTEVNLLVWIALSVQLHIVSGFPCETQTSPVHDG